MYNLDLKKGHVVDVYLDWKNSRSYQGKAELIEKIDEADSFYMDYETMYIPDAPKSNLGRIIDKQQLLLNDTYDYLENYLENSNNPDIRNFRSELNKLCCRKRSSFNDMYKCVENTRKQYEGNVTHCIHNVLNVPTTYIVRYIQQTQIKDWRPTIFRGEKWLVVTTSDDPFHIPFTTSRWVRVLVRISPKDTGTDLCKYTTYNARSSFQEELEEKEAEEIELLEEQMSQPESDPISEEIHKEFKDLQEV